MRSATEPKQTPAPVSEQQQFSPDAMIPVRTADRYMNRKSGVLKPKDAKAVRESLNENPN